MPVTSEFSAVFADTETVLHIFVVGFKITGILLRVDILQIPTTILLTISVDAVQKFTRTGGTTYRL
jgi:hypothetical protein